MADSYLERVAGELADMALADEERTGDEKIINEIAEVLGASSQTLQEAYLTAVRVRRAETRARDILIERGGEIITSKRKMITDERDGEKRKEKRDPTQFERPRREEPKKEEEKPAVEETPEPEASEEPQATPEESDIDTLDDVMDMLDNALGAGGPDAAEENKISPSRPKR